MTPEEGYRLARYQRPGVVIFMGPDEAEERAVFPLSADTINRLPGDPSLWARNMRTRLGFVPCPWVLMFATQAKVQAGHNVSNDEWRWLHGPATLIEARAWLKSLILAKGKTST